MDFTSLALNYPDSLQQNLYYSDKLKLKPFNERLLNARKLGSARTAVVWPCSDEAILGAYEAVREGLIIPCLIGPKQQIIATAKSLGINIDDYEIIDSPNFSNAAGIVIDLFNEGRIEMIMKGSLPSRDFILPLLIASRKISRLVSSHLMAIDLPGHDRTIFVTDAGINEYLKGERLVQVATSAVEALIKLGIHCPKVAILCATEKVNPSLISSITAEEAAEALQKTLGDKAIVEGPLSFDVAISAEIAQIKEVSSQVAGKVDLFVAQDINTANALVKSMSWAGKGFSSGVCLGINYPVAFPSRGGSLIDRVGSCAMSRLISR